VSLVDQFESVFRGADRRRYAYERIEVARVLVVTDLDAEEATGFTDALRAFLVEVEDARWTTLSRDDYDDVDAMLAAVREAAPDLVVSYRDLHYDTWRWPYSLGVFLNALTRETSFPVLVMPNPHEDPTLPFRDRETRAVMVLADHLTGDDRLVNWGVRFVRPEGVLTLTHVEDDAIFERYLDVIGKLPSIDTTVAREDISARLLKEPGDYIETCREVLAAEGHLTHELVPVLTMGHKLSDYVALIEEHEVDLLVMNTKDEDQLALHGTAYTLAVRLRGVPILML